MVHAQNTTLIQTGLPSNCFSKLAQLCSGGKYCFSGVSGKSRPILVPILGKLWICHHLSYGSKHGGRKVSDYAFIYCVIAVEAR